MEPTLSTGWEKLTEPIHSPTIQSEGIIEGVNVITGTYLEQNIDLVTQGIDPYVVERFYTRDVTRSGVYADLDCPNFLGWYAFYDSMIWYECSTYSQFLEGHMAVSQRSGSFVHYYRPKGGHQYKPDGFNGYMNHTCGILSGQNHIKNSYVVPQGGDLYSLYLGDGTIRNYFGKGLFRRESAIYGSLIVSEIKPSGNQVIAIPGGFQTISSDGQTILNWMTFNSPNGEANWTISTSDQKSITYCPGKRLERTPGQPICLLNQVIRPDGTSIYYHYNDHTYKGNDLLVGKDLPDGRFVRIEYVGNQVTTLIAPIGVDRTPLPKYRFEYGMGYTDVSDPLSNRTRYEYDDDKRITRIIYFKDDQPYRIEKNHWNSEGCLLAKQILDSQGNEYLSRHFTYDEYANVISETVHGVHGSYSKSYTYSNDRFNLLTSESDGTAKTEYYYFPDTNLLKAKIIKDRDTICLRQLFQYDVCGAVTEVIEDDGPDETLRKITSYTNRKEFPGVGQPEIKEEKYFDFDSQKEVLLKLTVYHYNEHNQCIQEDIYDALGEFSYSLFKDFDAMGRCIYETDSIGYEIFRSFDANGNLIKQIGPRPDVTIENGYDFSNRLIWAKKTDGYGNSRTNRYRYDLCGNRIAEMDESGHETLYTFDSLGREISITYPSILDRDDHPVSHTVLKRYDLCDNIIEWVDENGDCTQASYTFRGQPYHKKSSSSQSEEFFEYDHRGNLLKKIEPDGSYTQFSYDFLDRVVKIDRLSPSGQLLRTISSTYSSFHLIEAVDAEGVSTQIEYDGAGREICVTCGDRATRKTYDDHGYLSSLQEGDVLKCYTYDFEGQLLEEATEDLSGRIFTKVNYAYDADHNCIASTQFSSLTSTATTYFVYDGFGREIEKRDPLGHLTHTEYKETVQNGCGGLGPYEKIIDPLGRITERYFDARGRLVREIVDKAQHRQLRYDGVGNLVLERYEKKPSVWQEIRYTYGTGGRVTQITDPDHKVRARFSYDTRGRLIQKTTPLSEHIFSYDFLGNVTHHLAKSSSEHIDIYYTYDLNGRVQTIEQNGRVTNREYDQHGNVIFEKQESGFELNYTYDLIGRRESMRLPDGSFVVYHYEGPFLQKVFRYNASGEESYSHHYLKRDLCGRVLTAQLSGEGGIYEAHYDLAGNHDRISTSVWEQHAQHDPCDQILKLETEDVLGNYSDHFGYDGLSQLINENENNYAYDGVGNRLNTDVGPCNQLYKSEDRTFIYDVQGRMVKANQTPIHYDPLDRMIQYKNTTYGYDGLNRRISKDNEWFIYDGNREIGRINGRGELIEFRLLAEGQGADLGATIALELDTRLYATVSDIRGNIACAVYQKTGQPSESYRYSAFGEVTHVALNRVKITYSWISNPWKFASKREDRESGWSFFGRRYYSAKTHRFTTPDPLGYKEGPNLYLFGHNNPLTHNDLYGYRDGQGPLESRSCADFIGQLFRHTMHAIEWIGKNLIPLPGVRDVVESVGRWGAGGKLFDLAEYRKSRTQEYYVGGDKVEGVSLVYANGVNNLSEEAIASGKSMSEKYGGTQVVILYNSTNGLMMDLIECFLLKLGGISPPEKLFIDYIGKTLNKSPNEIIIFDTHSQAGLHLYNAAKQLSPDELNHIEAITYGSAKLIPKGIFREITNYVSYGDFVPLFDTMNYIKARLGNRDHVIFLDRSYYNPIKEHMINEKTYQKAMSAEGKRFVKRYL